jgi:hypothetical protein
MNAIDMASPLALNKAIWLKRPPSIEDEPLLAFDVSGILSPAIALYWCLFAGKSTG